MPFDLEWVRSHLPGRHIEWHSSVDSTMFAATRLAAEGFGSGTIVGADEQTAGHGRYGRPWHSEPESGLYVSMVLRVPVKADALPVVTLALGLAAADAITRTAGIACDLRWPNDVLIGDKKCAGILPQLDDSAIVVGFGVNANHTTFPASVASLATSLRIATGRTQSREQLLVHLATSVDLHCGILENEGIKPILDMFTHASSYVRGRRVAVDQGETHLTGITAGLTEAGFLRLCDDSGKLHTILAGGVRPCS